MNTSALQNFASDARRRLMGAVSAKLDAALAPGSSARVDVPAVVERLEQEIKEQSERMVSILKSMEKNYTEEQQREIKELLVEAGVLFTTSQYHALQLLHF